MCCSTCFKMRPLIFVLLNAIFVSQTQAEYEPTSENSENVTALAGSSAVLFCNSNLTMETDTVHTTWLRRRDDQMLAVDMVIYSYDERFMPQHKAGTNEWALRIQLVRSEDQGTYECQTIRGKEHQSYFVHLTVINPRAVISGNDQYRVGSTITLDCTIEESQIAPEYIFWYHNARILNYDKGRVTVTTDMQPPSSHSQLTVSVAAPTDAGNYTCAPSNAKEGIIVVYIMQDQPTYENVTALSGSSAVLSCDTNLTMDTESEVTWIRRNDLHILASGMYSYSRDERFEVRHKAGSNEWALRIRFVLPRDQGTYECQTTRSKEVQPHLVHLTVITPRAVIPGNSQYDVASGSTITLDCIVKESPSAPEYIHWYHNGRILNYDKGRVTVTIDMQPLSSHSQLTVSVAAPTDAGNYTCAPTNIEPATAVVYITKATEGGEAPLPSFSPWEIPLILLRLVTLLLGQQ